MKNSGPNSPQTIRGLLNRRSLRGIMDTRWQQEADIVTAPMGNPFGKGFHELKTPSGTHYVVGDQTGGRTFAPDTEVMVAIPQGRHNKAVIGGAPANKKGGGARNTSRRRRGTVVLDSNQYAWGNDGVDMHAMLYADGAYVSTRATMAAGGDTVTGCILTDSSLVVGDGSFLMRGTSALYVWDVEGAALHSYSVPSGWVNPTPPYYQNGFLYWCEFEDIPSASIGSGDATFDYRLRRSATDLSSVTTVATVTSANASTYGAPYTAYQEPAKPIAFAVDADGVILYLECNITEITNHEIAAWAGLQARISLAGSATVRGFTTPEMAVSGLGYLDKFYSSVTVGVTSFAIAAKDTGVSSIVSKSDDATTGPSNLWGASDLDGRYVYALSIGTGGAVIQVHDAYNGTLLRGISSGTVIATSIDAFDGTNYPDAMFYFGT